MILTKAERFTIAAIMLVWGLIWTLSAISPARIGGWERQIWIVVVLLVVGCLWLVRTLTSED